MVTPLGFGARVKQNWSGVAEPLSTTFFTDTVASWMMASVLMPTFLAEPPRRIERLAPGNWLAPLPAPTPASAGEASRPPHSTKAPTGSAPSRPALMVMRTCVSRCPAPQVPALPTSFTASMETPPTRAPPVKGWAGPVAASVTSRPESSGVRLVE
jgi:hypothetical protein